MADGVGVTNPIAFSDIIYQLSRNCFHKISKKELRETEMTGGMG